MRLSIIGLNPPGSEFPRPDGSLMHNVHVGVQFGRHPGELIKADVLGVARWDLEIETIERDGELDFRGSVVQGKRGERFVYLNWVNVIPPHLEGFRRAKLMLNRVDADVLRSAIASGQLEARIDLTDEKGGPRCATVKPPAVEWSAPGSP